MDGFWFGIGLWGSLIVGGMVLSILGAVFQAIFGKPEPVE